VRWWIFDFNCQSLCIAECLNGLVNENLWEVDDYPIPTTTELQWGKMFNARFGAFVDGLAGIGGDRPYVCGVSIGMRMMC